LHYFLGLSMDEVRKFLRSTKDLSPSFVETRDGEAGTN
jgi:hypothetical protein